MDREVGSFSKFNIDIGKQQLFLNSLSRTQYIVEQSHKAIQDNSKLLDNYCTDGDLDGILSMYDNDIELIEPQTPICRGLGALQVYYETMKKLRLLPQKRCITELHALSPFIVLERGKYKMQRVRKISPKEDILHYGLIELNGKFCKNVEFYPREIFLLN